MSARPSWSPLPADCGVTVVIPTKNEEGAIAEIIDAVRPYASEILVVDGHSTDGTREIAAARQARVILDARKGKGEALRRSFIYERVWDSDARYHSNSLEVYVSSLRRKLEKQGHSRLIHTLRGVGYVLRADPG